MALIVWVIILTTFSSVAVLLRSFLKIISPQSSVNSFLSRRDILRVWVIAIAGTVRFLHSLAPRADPLLMTELKMPRLVKQLA